MLASNAAANTPQSAPQRSRLRFALGVTFLVACAALLALHVRTYWFVTDDAYISFRYARHWAEGVGLVFNAGEHVEGYTNFLWVALLAALARIGFAPEQVAPWISAALTFVLWGLATRFVARARQPAVRVWWWVTPLALASNRCFSVWATGGLETRLFELLLLGGLARLWIESEQTPRKRRVTLGPWLLALAVLTRPDALLPALGGAIAIELRQRRTWRDRLRTWLPFVVLTGGHELWRIAYYHAPLPNTYYAKFDGVFAGARGWRYALFFALEYALFLWLPFLVCGARALWQSAPHLLAIFAAALVPFVAYVVYAGGDHFEMRPLGLLVVPLAVLLAWGVADVAARVAPRRFARPVVATAAVVCIAASALLPTLAHLDFPAEYALGFPGSSARPDGTQTLVRPERIPTLAGAMGFGLWVAAYDRLASELTAVGAGVRQEEHRAFAAATSDVGHDLRGWVEDGTLPADTRIALHCVGAIPYWSRLWTLDLLGLCDAQVGRGPWGSGERHVAHAKWAAPDYIRRCGVEIQPALPCRFFVADATLREVAASGGCDSTCAVVRLAPDFSLFVRLPQGLAAAHRRFPRLAFEALPANP